MVPATLMRPPADNAASNDKTAPPHQRLGRPGQAPDPLHDDQPVTLESDTTNPGELKVRHNKTGDPKEGQKVKFVISNTTKDTVGVVLAIDGKSTLFAEDLTSKQPGECTKWILARASRTRSKGSTRARTAKRSTRSKCYPTTNPPRSSLPRIKKGCFPCSCFVRPARRQAPTV